MKAAVVTDLHVGITPAAVVRELRARIEDEGVDVVVLGGDLGEPLHHFKQALDLFVGYPGRVGVLAGNHDVWSRPPGPSSRDLWEHELPDAVRERSFAWLEDETLVIGDTAVAGTIAWYDYSSRSSGYALKSDADFFRTKSAYNNDGNFINWPWDDVTFCRFVQRGFVERLEALERNPRVSHVVVVTHVPLFPEQKVVLKKWNTAGEAYYGNWTLGHQVERYHKVRVVVSGHTHLGCVARHRCPDGRSFPVIVVGSDYGKPAYYVASTD